MKTIELQIVETIHYGREFTIDELNDLCIKHGVAPHIPDGETGDLTAWLQDEASEGLRRAIEAEPGLLEDIEQKSGDAQGQSWTWEVSR